MGVAVFRRVAVVAAPAVLVAVLSGCSSGEDAAETKPSPVKASASVAGMDKATPEEEAPDDSVPSVKPGGSAVFKGGPTAMTVSVSNVEYIPTPKGAMGSDGQTIFARIHLTVKNTGKAPGEFSADTSEWSSKDAAPLSSTVVTEDSKDRLTATYQPGQSAAGDVVVGAGAKGGEVTFFDAQDDTAPTFKVELPKS